MNWKLLSITVSEGGISAYGRWFFLYSLKETKPNYVGFSPQANYTDRAAAACRRSYCQLLRVEVVAWSAQRIRYIFYSSSSSIIRMRMSAPRFKIRNCSLIFTLPQGTVSCDILCACLCAPPPILLLRMQLIGRMPSSGMLRRVTLVRTNVSEKRSASIIRVKRIGQLRTVLQCT
jgi:hypothetical protein